jgi:hypothetical protein
VGLNGWRCWSSPDRLIAWPWASPVDAESLHGDGARLQAMGVATAGVEGCIDQSWRQTATSRPCTLTWSAGSTIGA